MEKLLYSVVSSIQIKIVFTTLIVIMTNFCLKLIIYCYFEVFVYIYVKLIVILHVFNRLYVILLEVHVKIGMLNGAYAWGVRIRRISMTAVRYFIM